MTPTESRLDTASKPPRAVRPTLGTRKSTMSVTIEQRLREMEVVHNMLRIAMAEDGDEDDEVKEEYGKRADESLASLRLSLEEARRIEGVDQREPTFQESTSPAVHPEHNTDKLQISLAESENKVGDLSPSDFWCLILCLFLLGPLLVGAFFGVYVKIRIDR